jgi:UDP-N-acetylmuramyl pentapeptide phosphotransferase/UDP-N-acetylglucosamine-1-phosphate transferase
LWPALALVLSIALSASLAWAYIRSPNIKKTFRPNYAQLRLPVVLGRALVVSALSAGLFSVLLFGRGADFTATVVLAVGARVLLFVGRLDDRAETETRGFRGHLGSLRRGRPTTGILKLAVGLAVAAGVSIAIGGGPLRVVAGTLSIALSINVTNALDVRPGRALKFSLLALIPAALLLPEGGLVLLIVAFAGAGLGLLPFDLGERGMLGDAGSNPLGLVVGTGLAAVLPLWGLVVAILILAGLQVAAETVTISRFIEAVPPLQWFDRLGRRT